MKWYSQAVLTPEQRVYNRRHGNSQVIVENTFGLLKSRFRVLSRKCESNPENTKHKCLAAVILHNILHQQGDLIDNTFEQIDTAVVERDQNQRDNAAAARVRDVLLPLVQ